VSFNDSSTNKSFRKNLSQNAFVQSLKKLTPARIGIGHAGGRYRTESQLKFRHDLAVSRDAVRREVPSELVKNLGLIALQSRATNRDIYLMNTRLGRELDDASRESLKKSGTAGADIQIITSDGLSSEAFEKNVPEMLPLLSARLKQLGLRVADPIFIRWARVAIIDDIGAILRPRAALILLGERPGLGISDSLSGYFEFSPGPGRVESDRNVLSNIHRQGIPAAEAALMLADALNKILTLGRSGMTVRFDFA
jgi:ethanolamine ammonia-lyase small subunit